jgi:ABC-type multidrug transport system fused ATPase/permease subunit
MLRSSLNKYLGNVDKLIAVASQASQKPLYIGLVTAIIASFLDGIGIGLMIPLLDLLLNKDKIPSIPTLFPMAQSLNIWLGQQDKGTLIVLSATILMVSFTLKALISYISQCLITFYRESFIADLRERLYENYLRAPVTFFDNVQLGRVTTTMFGETINVNITLNYLFSAVTAVFTLVAYLATLLWASWQLTLVIVLLIILVGFTLTTLLKSIKSSGQAALNAIQDMSVHILDTFGGVRIVKSYGAEAFEIGKFKRISRRLQEVQVGLSKKQNLIDPLTEWATLAIAMLILIGSYILLISQGLLSTAALLTFMLVLVRIIPVTKKINAMRGAIQENLPSLRKVMDALELDDKYPVANGQLPFTGLVEGIAFRDVRFSYGGKSDVLRGFNLEVPKGKTIALVGSSGAGKSTLASLIPRLYDISSGQIEIDGHDIQEYDVTSLRHHIGIVSQDTYIFSASLRNNIAYGLEGVSELQITEAARLANAHDFISKLPNGYDTLVGDRGVQLSGGQRQRISIARAILRDPDILILDEATSALDSQSEHLVQDAIERLRQNRTVVVIAHRLSTIRNADRIVVLDQGQVVESGEHSELLRQKGAYWSFHNLQAMPTA